jgi:hypothetical protein
MHLDLATILSLISTADVDRGPGLYRIAIAGVESNAAGADGDYGHPVGAERSEDGA